MSINSTLSKWASCDRSIISGYKNWFMFRVPFPLDSLSDHKGKKTRSTLPFRLSLMIAIRWDDLSPSAGLKKKKFQAFNTNCHWHDRYVKFPQILQCPLICLFFRFLLFSLSNAWMAKSTKSQFSLFLLISNLSEQLLLLLLLLLLFTPWEFFISVLADGFSLTIEW